MPVEDNTNNIKYSSVLQISSSASLKDDEEKARKKSWRAPILMLFGLIVGIGFAIGHHYLYKSFGQQPVSAVSISQSWIHRVGTLMAFLTKLFFGLSISVAFVQLQWLRLRSHATTVKDLDAVSAMLSSFISLLDGSVIRFPLLAVMALVCWLLPIIPIIASGTINVVPSPTQNITNIQVPQLDLYNGSMQWFNGIEFVSDGNNPPISALSRIAKASAMTSQIIPATPRFSESSYTLKFTAPAVKCQNANSSVVADAANRWPNDDTNLRYTPYVAWVAGDRQYGNWTGTSYPDNLDLVSTDNARIFVMVTSGSGDSPSVTECTFWNSSYTLDFQYHSGQQTVDVISIDTISNYSLALAFDASHGLLFAGNGAPPGRDAYAAIIASLGSLLVGMESYRGEDQGLTIQYTSFEDLGLSDKLELLQPGIERLFRNIIISMFSRADFINNSSSPVGVNVSDVIQIYTYDPTYLLLTYGVALLITLACSVAGIYAFSINQDSYQNVFSSFFRATSNSNVRKMVSREDNGADPRPSRIGTAVLDLTRSGGSQLHEKLRSKSHDNMI